EIAGPGFINFFVQPKAWAIILSRIHSQKERFGSIQMGNGKRIQVEYVSSNPTGPLHVGHGRGAAVGDSVANILTFCGYNVQREYYVNDSGKQIRTLGLSVYLRLKEESGEKIDFPPDCYQGEYIRVFAKEIMEKGLKWESDEAGISFCARYAAEKITEGMRRDLETFGVVFDRWFSEQSLYDSGKVEEVLLELKGRGYVYEKDGALWFRSSRYGDEKDRVVIRKEGQATYFASDIAYHKDKFDRGFEHVIDVWGADHHGYIPRMSAAVQASGHQKDQFQVILIQLVNLLRSGQPVAMSTRAGEFVTLKDVIDEVGKDAARFIFLTRHHESPLDFDLEVAKKQTNDNPVYYVQYVHARISSIIRKGKERGIEVAVMEQEPAFSLTEPEEIAILKAFWRYPEVIYYSAKYMEPHRITYFLMELASLFHTYYNKHRVLTDDTRLTCDRISLVTAVKEIIRNGLYLLGVSAPETM
ncbi:MAG: arginine--tRNA ligase, partial [Thermodesulfobacteriota bacterium]